MSGAVISSNTSLKVNAAVNATTTTTGTLYTAPANAYAIVNLSAVSTGTGAGSQIVFAIGGNTIAFANTNVTGGNAPFFQGQVNNGAGTAAVIQNVIIGPSQALSVTISTGGRATVTGVELINSP